MNSSNYITPFWVQNVTSSTINVTIKKNNASAPTVDVYYSNDLSTWTLLGQTSTITLSLNVAAGNKVYFRSNADQWADTSSTFYYNYFSSTGNCHVGGNIMSLLYGSNFTGYEKVFPNENCYGIFNGLFVGWTNLVDAGELVLPVTHVESRTGAMGNRCYRALLNGCSNLINGPHVDLRFRDNPESDELYACMQRFIAGCPKLETIHINTQNLNGAFTDIFLSTNYNGLTWYDYSGNPRTVWPTNVTCVNVISMYIGYDRVVDWHSNYSGYVEQVDDNNSVTIYKKFRDDKYYEPFYVENTTSTTKTVHIKKNSNAEPGIMVQRSDDRTHWYDIAQTSTSGLTITLSQNQKVWLRANASYGWNRTGYGHSIYGSPKVGGNIMSLIYGSEFRGDETSFLDGGRMEFLGLFNSDTTLTNIANLILPVITMGESCYKDLFNGCTNLNTVPIIDAEILSDYCFMSMFEGCTSLLTAPVLKATSLAQGCYLGMFQGCTSLVIAPQLPATVLARSCYGAMFEGCTSLVNAPELPASTLVQDCYDNMFEQCYSLNNIKCLATSGVDQNNLTDWTLGLSSTGTFTKAAGVTWPSGSSGIPSGWTVEEQ